MVKFSDAELAAEYHVEEWSYMHHATAGNWRKAEEHGRRAEILKRFGVTKEAELAGLE